MPGYDKSRFVCLSQSEEDEFNCGICLAILKNPSVVPCCRQSYCRECIVQWLTTQQSCPNDRQFLTISQLCDPQRLVTNLLAKLRIRCHFFGDGCRAVSPLGSVSAHEDQCLFNPERKCADCGQKTADRTHSTRDCVNSLKLENKSLTEEIRRLRSEKRGLESQIKSLKENNGHNNTEYVRNFASFSLFHSFSRSVLFCCVCHHFFVALLV